MTKAQIRRNLIKKRSKDADYDPETDPTLERDVLVTFWTRNTTEKMKNLGTYLPEFDDEIKRYAGYVADYELLSPEIKGPGDMTCESAAGIGIRPLEAEFDAEKAQGIIDRVSSQPFEEIKWILNEPVKTFSKNVVDQTIKKNVEFQGKSGLSPKIRRTALGDACEWCQAVAGTYSYPNVPEDVYRRHANCDCVVEYIDGGKYQDVWSKKTYSQSQAERVTENQRRATLMMPRSDIIRARVRFKTGEMSPDEYAMAKHLLSIYKEECKIPYYRGREGLVEEFDNNLTDEEKGMSLIRKPVDSYWYTAIHWGHGQYRFIRAEAIDNDEEELRALFGDEYDDIFG